MLVEGAFGYDVMSAALTRRLRGKRVKAPGGRFVVGGVRVVGVGHGRIAVGLDFTGSDEGRIWLGRAIDVGGDELKKRELDDPDLEPIWAAG